MRHAGGLARAPEAALEALAEAPVPFVSAGITYDGGSPLITTFDSGPAVPYDSPFWLPAAENAAIIDSTHTLATLSGAAGASSFTTGDIGDESQYVLCDRFQVRYLQAPASATCSGTLRDDSGGAQQAGSVAARSDGSIRGAVLIIAPSGHESTSAPDHCGLILASAITVRQRTTSAS